MTRHFSTLAIALILLAGCLVGLDAYRRLRDAGATERESILAAMPPGASAVLFADLPGLRHSPFAAQLYNWIPKSQADADYTQFLRETGFDYERDLDLAAIAFIKSQKESKLFAVAKGRFDRQKIEAYTAHSGTRESRGGREILVVPAGDGTRKISFAFLGKDKIAFTDAADLSSFLAPAPNTSDARQWREHFRRLAGSPVLAVVRQDAAAGSALAGQTPGGFQSPQLSTLLDQLQWITLAGKPQDRSIRIVAEGECSNEQTSRQLADTLNGMILLAQAGLNGPQARRGLDARIRDAYLEILKSADVSRIDRGDAKSVRVVFDVTSNFLIAVSAGSPAPAAIVPTTPASEASEPKARSRKPARK